ncbi:peptidoglycan-binding domain-containing protein [Bradyrhizobium pachyrhizi]|uniref:peptidoglycan-binding domain-containing protein n=1 Tax=Bradyrhizobium pachyrhizi TaxID=280333 RepID=UPI003D369C37
MLISQLFSGSADLELIAAGGRRMLAPEVSDSVALVQQALLAIGFSLQSAGVDGLFGQETGDAVAAFKSDRVLLPNDPVVGVKTINRLDREVAWLEGAALSGVIDPTTLDTKTLLLDPLQAGVIENQLGDLSIGQKVLDVWDLGDRVCFRASFLFDRFIAQALGRFIEPFVFENFCEGAGPCTADDFLDEAGPLNYTAFLKPRNPQVPPARIDGLASMRRPDIISHRTPKEWYEIKPASVWSATEAWLKLNDIIPAYATRGLPYKPGTNYQPTDVVLGRFLTPEGEKLDLILNLRRQAPGLIFYILCVKGDYVAYFNRVRIAAGVAALLIALSEALVPAAEVAGVLATLKGILEALAIVAAPALQRL